MKMASTKQTAKKSTGGIARRKKLASVAARLAPVFRGVKKLHDYKAGEFFNELSLLSLYKYRFVPLGAVIRDPPVKIQRDF
jgi:hypothetical protein